ncbi:DUF3995 domain-containing protein [Streptomyces sp. fd1-xmd]|uniref:DUF3995 domain-containing protein n=1 Tax=Streptomyces sp. fd1-xmd TaxID=1812480 RepID=UPI0009906CBD|nr:DUF3995 domain-containing protein [Streptomyces sp. fd1-xmd]AQT76098.1 hypothetical protein B1K54_34925 [Streptomyces sp. fd1-xmd]
MDTTTGTGADVHRDADGDAAGNGDAGAHAGAGAGGADGGGTAAVPRPVRAAAVVAAGGLAAAAALHVVWIRSPWPLGSPAELAEVVVGTDQEGLPPAAATAAVAGLLAAASGTVLACARPDSALGRARPVRAGLWAVSAVLAARGLGGLVVSGLDLQQTPARYTAMDLRVYSPLCIALSSLTGYVASRTRRRAGRL